MLSSILTFISSIFGAYPHDIIWQDKESLLSIHKTYDIADPVFKNLQICYECEFSPITLTNMTENGEYDQTELASHWSLDHDIYIFYHENIPAGFCVVNNQSMISHDKNIHDIAEFYITPIFRKQKFGTILATTIINLYKGKWEIRQLVELENTSRLFWLKVIKQLNHKDFKETKNLSDCPCFVQQFTVL